MLLTQDEIKKLEMITEEEKETSKYSKEERKKQEIKNIIQIDCTSFKQWRNSTNGDYDDEESIQMKTGFLINRRITTIKLHNLIAEGKKARKKK